MSSTKKCSQRRLEFTVSKRSTLSSTKANTASKKRQQKTEEEEEENEDRQTHDVSPTKRSRAQENSCTKLCNNVKSVENGDTSSNANSLILCARQRLGLGLPDELTCREKELDILREKIQCSITNSKPCSMYLSGPPGTGKTACVRHTLRSLKKSKQDFTQVYINCMGVRTPNSIYRLVLDGLQSARKSKNPLSVRQIESCVKNELVTSKNMIVLVLDEIDQLETRNHDILYMAFKWPSIPSSRVILLGIANSLDLTERLLPKLKLHVVEQPVLMQFRPYTKDEVIAILKYRLLQADQLLEPAAVELCARKVSSVTGDIRKALDICKLAIERMERRKPKVETENSVPQQSTNDKVGCRDILDTLKDVYGPKLRKSAITLPLQQKLVLSAALALASRSKQNHFSLSKLSSTYRQACAAARVQSVDQSECLNLCQLLEAHGLLSLTTSRRNSTGSMVHLLVDQEAAKSALNDEVLVATVFSKVAV